MTQTLRIALISEHASPLACVGGIDAGGQSIYVDHVARTLAARGHQVDVLTRRDDPALPWVVHLCSGARVIHIPAGPPCFVRKEELLDFMGEFTYASEWLMRTAVSYDLMHANFFMSGLVAQHLKRTLRLPFVMSFHALGLVRREHQEEADAFPDERIAIERSLVHDADAVVAECPQDRTDLVRLYGAEEAQLATRPRPAGPGGRRIRACCSSASRVPPHDPPALAVRIAQLHADPVLAARMGQAGTRRVHALFTWDRVVDELLAVYQSVRQEKPAVAPRRPRRVHTAGPLAGAHVSRSVS